MATRTVPEEERELNRCDGLTHDTRLSCPKPARYDVNGDGVCRDHLPQMIDWWHNHGRDDIVVKPWRWVTKEQRD